MRDLTRDEFDVAWSTYWGRREMGMVVNNPIAVSIGSRTQSLRLFHEQWREALAAFPGDSRFWLLGTPDLTPELFSAQSTDGDAPPPAPRVGRFVVEDREASFLSEVAGDFTVEFPRNSEAARTARRMVRGRAGIIVSVASLAVVWLPLFSVPLAVISLVWLAQVDVLLRRGRARWRYRWPTVAGQFIAVVSIALSVLLALSPQAPT